MRDRNRVVVPLLAVCAFLTAICVRAYVVSGSDLPTGDEVNTYILNAEKLLAHGVLPDRGDHPAVSVLYASLMSLIDAWSGGTALSSVLAADVVAVVSGGLTAFFVFMAFRLLLEPGAALVCAMSMSLFPGMFLYPSRGDLNLYFACLSGLQWAFVALIRDPTWAKASGVALIGVLFCFCRSDGAFVLFLTLAGAWAVFPMSRGWIAKVVGLSFVLFLTATYGWSLLRGEVGGGAGSRALDAFYQAEGLHAATSDSWHDYTAQGIAKFGGREQYKNSVIRIIAANPAAVLDRGVVNMGLLLGYLKESVRLGSGSLAWVIVLGWLAMAGLGRVVLFAVVPCMMTSTIYLAFYFQRSYYVLLSYGVALAMALGLMVAIRWLRARFFAGWSQAVVAGLALVVVVTWFGSGVPGFVPGTQRETTRTRFGGALLCARQELAADPLVRVYVPPHGGSDAFRVYLDVAEGDVVGGLESEAPADSAARLRQAGVSVVLAGVEHPGLWGLGSAAAELMYENRGGTVRVWGLAP